MAIYESEHTRFMREWLQQHPEQVNVAKTGRELWWDKGMADMDSRRREAESCVPSKAYYYDVN